MSCGYRRNWQELKNITTTPIQMNETGHRWSLNLERFLRLQVPAITLRKPKGTIVAIKASCYNKTDTQWYGVHVKNDRGEQQKYEVRM
jgi:hypothetical protein